MNGAEGYPVDENYILDVDTPEGIAEACRRWRELQVKLLGAGVLKRVVKK